MTGGTGPDTAASIRQRLLNLARNQGIDFPRMLTRYGLERFLYRLSRSKYADRFVLKGAMLYSIWAQNPTRPTGDVDLLGYGDFTVENLISTIQEICKTAVEDDGLVFNIDSIRAEEIREAQEYGGLRVKLTADLSGALRPLQIDVGLGDPVVPEAILRDYPVILELPAPRLLIYPKESVISEKYQAMVNLGMANTRMKDYYDIWYLIGRFEFKGKTVCQAIQATFDARDTPIPTNTPLGLSEEFGNDPEKNKQWNAFLNRTGLDVNGQSLVQVVEHLKGFLMPPTEGLATDKKFIGKWRAGGPWVV